jgi:PAS domain S-box-containing protein
MPSTIDMAARFSAVIALQQDVLSAATDPDQVMQLVARRAPAITTGAAAMILLVEGDELVCHAASSTAATLERNRFPFADTVAGTAICGMTIVRCEDTDIDGRADAAACRGIGLRSMVFAPLSGGKNIAGTLAVMSRSRGAFDDLDAYATQLLAGLTSGALMLARQFRECQASEERYRMLFERNVAGVFRSTADGRFLDCNAAFAAYLGYESREELLACESWSLYQQRSEREAFLERLQRERSITSIRLHLKRKDGSPVNGLVNATLIPGEDGESQLLGTLVEE